MQYASMEPAKEYESVFKGKHIQCAKELFDELVEKSKVDAAENARTMEKLERARHNLSSARGVLSKRRALSGFLIFLSCLFALLAVVFLFVFTQNGPVYLAVLLPVVCALALTGCVLIICLKINPRIKEAKTETAELTAQVTALEQEGWKQMRALNLLFEDSMPEELVAKVCPLIRFDRVFDATKYRYFSDLVGLGFGERCSVTGLRSGVSGGNPFMFLRFLSQTMTMRTYSGSITVSWTETEGDKTVSRSETLTASVTHEAPVWHSDGMLYYANDAAPSLHFSRHPRRHATEGKQLEKQIRKGEKRLEKLAREATVKGGSFVKLANSEFEVMFDAVNRDNEQEFRLMYTPLAQKNTVDLLKGVSGYGDDFSFTKQGRVNIIRTRHSGGAYTVDPNGFMGYDLKKIEKNFMEYNISYFKRVFFDFAPLFAVPLYLQQKPETDFSRLEPCEEFIDEHCESVVNLLSNALAPKGAGTQSILKASRLESDGEGTVFEVTAHAFCTIDRVDYVSRHCSNGNWYDVPVHWVEYIPVSRTTNVLMRRLDMTRAQYLAESRHDSILVGGIETSIL